MPNIPLYKQIANDLLQLTKENDGNFKLPSEKQVAQKYNVSRVTARRAFFELEKKSLINRYPGKGTFTADERHKPQKARSMENVALITPGIGTAYSTRLIYGADEFFKVNNINMSVMLSNNDIETESKLIKHCLASGYDGILLYPSDYQKYSEQILRLYFKKYPLCLIDRNLKMLNLPCVSSDNYSMIRQLVDVLCGRGCRSLVFLSFKDEIATTNEERNKAFHDAMIKHFGKVTDGNFLEIAGAALEKLPALLENFLLSHPATDAIITGYNIDTLQCMIEVFKKLSIGLSTNVALAFIDNEVSSLIKNFGIRPFIVEQDAATIGREAAKLLYDNLKRFKPNNIYVPAKIILPEEY